MLIDVHQVVEPGPAFVADRVVRRELDACVLLAGALRPSPLVEAAGCSVLDFYLTPDSTVLGLWIDRLTELEPVEADEIPLRIVHGRTNPVPRNPGGAALLGLRIVQEAGEYRGPAGVARDACEGLDPDATILLADAGRYIATSLEPMLRAHRERRAGVTVACNADRTPAGVYLIQRRTLDLVPRAGFVDLKEQWLRRALEGGVGVWTHVLGGVGAGAGSLPIRTRPRGGAVVAPGAAVAPGAYAADCIIMPGARVEAGAVVARSVVGPGALVASGAEVIDEVFVSGRTGVGEGGGRRVVSGGVR
jgi:hypothetical protein